MRPTLRNHSHLQAQLPGSKFGCQIGRSNRGDGYCSLSDAFLGLFHHNSVIFAAIELFYGSEYAAASLLPTNTKHTSLF